MKLDTIQKNLNKLFRKSLDRRNFIYDLMAANGIPKATITRLKKGNRNLSKIEGRIISRDNVLFENSDSQNIHELFESLKKDPKSYQYNPRFIVVTDFKQILAVDTKTLEELKVAIEEIVQNPWFFAPWGKIERNVELKDHPADVKAAESMANIYIEIAKYNNNFDVQAMSIFFTRLLFCYFAEDTGIFSGNDIFTDLIKNNSKPDGSDLDVCLNELFETLSNETRHKIPHYLKEFPFVNGSLFTKKYSIPRFTSSARRQILKCSELDWSQISPDIFGSIFQGIVLANKRHSQGMHYTSVPNILKVIKPLFLDGLREEFKKVRGDKYEENKLKRLLTRLANLRIFDPACGSGNFLIVAYKEICRLEMDILKRIDKLTKTPKFSVSGIHISQFYGIEMDPPAREIATVSMYLALHQMNMEFKSVFNRSNDTLPLKENQNIVCGNAVRIDWEEVCPKTSDTEIYILGNPPFLGSKKQDVSHKKDLEMVFFDQKNFRTLDYVSCWFKLASRYIKGSNAKFAFVSTNSICQGEQVSMLWPNIFQENQSIHFAYESFKWGNNAKGTAAVSCIIVGVSNNDDIKKRYLYIEDERREVKHISPYLKSYFKPMISRRTVPLSNQFPPMILGSKLVDDGNLKLSLEQFNKIKLETPEAMPYIKRYMGAGDFINGSERFCLWITDDTKDVALNIPIIKQKVEKCHQFRMSKDSALTQEKAQKPWEYYKNSYQCGKSFLIPRVTTKQRKYIPVGLFDEKTVIGDSAQIIYDGPLFVFGILSSRMHVLWVSETCGEMGDTGFRYSSELGYNTFPLPELTISQKQTIENHVYNIIGERSKHMAKGKTIAELYSLETMPSELKVAHEYLDNALEQCYQSADFTNDEERIEHLFKLYESKISKEKGELAFINRKL